MSLTKLLSVITIIIIVSFSMMLGTSYAWYAFESASTTFSGVTNNDDIVVTYQKGEYINTNVAVPISSDDIAKYSEKNNFNIRVRDNIEGNEIAVSVSLIDISIDDELKDVNFKIDLLYQGSNISSTTGNKIDTSKSTSITLGTVTLDNDLTNLFEVRVYLLDNGDNQTSLMNKTFSAKLEINVISRLKTSLEEYNDTDIYVSSILIDGEESSSLPTTGYYDMASTCTKGSTLTWESLSKTITYSSGSYVKDDCSLTFTSSTDYPLLSEMEVGSYVKYTGNNGCIGKACEGQNANYVSEANKGHCGGSNEFYNSGWRIGYIENGSAYLLSAGATDCMCTNSDGTTSIDSCSSAIGYGKESIHFDNMDNVALKYCNKKYINDGICNVNTIWAMDGIDFEKITGKQLKNGSTSCTSILCDYINDLIDIGGSYYFATTAEWGTSILSWKDVSVSVNFGRSNGLLGVRPIIYLDSSVVVVDGDGTYENPYEIAN